MGNLVMFMKQMQPNHKVTCICVIHYCIRCYQTSGVIWCRGFWWLH